MCRLQQLVRRVPRHSRRGSWGCWHLQHHVGRGAPMEVEDYTGCLAAAWHAQPSCAENTGHARVRSPCATALTRNNTVHVCTRDIARTSASDRGWREQLRTRKLELWLSSGGLASMPTLPLRASRPSARPWRRYGPSKHSQKRTSSVVLSRRWCQAGRCPPRSPA